ncbi:MAG: hypothetical protein L6R40_008579, partial [Gallowayella cf. fulva]
SGSCPHPFTPACKLSETRTVLPELCRECRLKQLLAQAPMNHDDIVEEEEEEEEEEEDERLRGKERGLGTIEEVGEETEGLLGRGAGRGKVVERRGRRNGWLRKVW